MKDKLVRFGVSLEGELSRRFDAFIKAGGYDSRSKAIADLIRKEFVTDLFDRGGVVAGAVTIVYDHHRREVVNKLLDIQHDHGGIIISSTCTWTTTTAWRSSPSKAPGRRSRN